MADGIWFFFKCLSCIFTLKFSMGGLTEGPEVLKLIAVQLHMLFCLIWSTLFLQDNTTGGYH